ncbi:glycoside hydrolase family 99-like domain-containing protein [Stutzerimonas zhaodongensis]|uniref:glycoside hydrolase family 99-like domain-containing protein n=1 Tax=Stutzerimonas zhaodongensis TaxID=1176257 RepID=UPI0039EEC2A8
MKMEPKMLVAVLGMHRSGTSAITRGLRVLGVELGERLLAPQAGSNEKGFWEDGDVTALNNELLAALGHDWQSLTPISEAELLGPLTEDFKLQAVQLLRDRYNRIECYGVKDPRMARLLPFWQSVFEHLGLQVKYVIACRNPMSVAQSLVKRNQFDMEKSYLLWLEHMLSCLRHTSGAQRIFVDYDLMLSNPHAQLERISHRLDLPFIEAELREYSNEFLESSLRHNQFSPEDLCLDPAASQDVVTLNGMLSDLARDRRVDDAEVAQLANQLHTNLSEQRSLYRLARRFEDRNAALAQALAEVDTALARANSALAEANDVLVERNKRIDQGAAELELRLAELEQQSREIALLDHRISALTTELGASNTANRNLQEGLERYASGRFLLRALMWKVMGRIGIAGVVDGRRYRAIAQSGLFDAEQYLRDNADIAAAGVDPLWHFLEHGWLEGRDPSASFSTRAYLDTYADVRLGGLNPLVHYVLHGRNERRIIQNAAGQAAILPVHKSRRNKVLELSAKVARHPGLLLKFAALAKEKGVRHAAGVVLARLKQQSTELPVGSSVVAAAGTKDELLHNTFRVVPFYLNPYLETPPESPVRSVAVHLHLYYDDMLDECIAYLNNVPTEFDLFVSVPEGRDAEGAAERISEAVPLAREVIVEEVPNRGRDIAPFIIQFGRRLKNYDIVGHFHTKKSPQCETLTGWFRSLMDVLCGSQSGVAQIFGLLANDGKVVYPAGRRLTREHSGWSDNFEIARDLVRQTGHFNLADFPYVEFPQGTMFWARGECLHNYLQLPLSFSDFPEEPIEVDGTLAHALERLVLIYSTPFPGRNYRLESPELSCEPQEYYEEQYDFSRKIKHDTIKVLAYYLPQFHPTPENDEWHGKGFTEWYKVRAANPLFQGHYQQHVPHSDVGYYHLDSPVQLARQADQMRQAGVHGLIFYHYWFAGKLILEKPAQMLLENPQIDMPFSFCWANENWTRRWDGNEKEILLGQVYSHDDARDFIRYMIPFFKDARYIKVDGRPLLFVYRPSSMEQCDDYLAIWRQECAEAGVASPYVVATLTRGATAPQDYGMDAAVERVLQDWTGGAVPDIKHQLRPYGEVNGSILNYTAVADHYMEKPLDNDYVLFRSLVPTWDNTARYGTEAFALHGFNPAKMQTWMESLIRYSEQNLPADRRFVVVNAWNEWAEGAHLEPDMRFGYGYLNAIGRAMCGYPFTDASYVELDADVAVMLEIAPTASSRLVKDPEARRKFFRCLANSSVFDRYRVVTDDAVLAAGLKEQGVVCDSAGAGQPATYRLIFRDLYIFPSDAIEALLRMAKRHPGFDISATLCNDPAFIHGSRTENFAVTYGQRSGMELIVTSSKGFKSCPAASCFALGTEPETLRHENAERVSTIIRFHRNGDQKLLNNAIFSLLSQAGCRVQPYLALQDMTDNEVSLLEEKLATLPWHNDCFPIIRRYQSTPDNPDLRSLMLNDALKAVASGYAAFLDYDDVLFPHAYEYLLKNLKATNKNATFGRVYSTTVDAGTGLIVKRERVYDYGFSYSEFLHCNHAPLHSFMLNLDRIDLGAITYFDDMKYMEDYYLTLQLFNRRDTDWASLQSEAFIGDYVHREGDATNTLAVSDLQARKELLSSKHFLRCEGRIKALRERVMS